MTAQYNIATRNTIINGILTELRELSRNTELNLMIEEYIIPPLKSLAEGEKFPYKLYEYSEFETNPETLDVKIYIENVYFAEADKEWMNKTISNLLFLSSRLEDLGIKDADMFNQRISVFREYRYYIGEKYSDSIKYFKEIINLKYFENESNKKLYEEFLSIQELLETIDDVEMPSIFSQYIEALKTATNYGIYYTKPIIKNSFEKSPMQNINLIFCHKTSLNSEREQLKLFFKKYEYEERILREVKEKLLEIEKEWDYYYIRNMSNIVSKIV